LDDSQRLARWEWLTSHVAIVLRARGHTEIQSQYADEDQLLEMRQVGHLDLSAEHVLPRTVPPAWSRPLRRFYGAAVDDLAEATLSVVYKEKAKKLNDVRYFAAASSLESVPKPISLETEAFSLETIELPSPGKNYDEAYRMILRATRHRLSSDNKNRDDALAAAYLQSLGFQVLRVRDFIKNFGEIEPLHR
ncbi:MAG: hypothetical protein ACR2RE_11660, partial [Geminicoccaceae bacterium]